MQFEQFFGFAVVSLALALVPGPSWIFVISTTVGRDRRAGLVAILGNATGILVHVLAVAAGLSAVLSYSASVYAVVKWLGAAYLIYLGVRTIWLPAPPDAAEASRRPAATNTRNARAFHVFGHGVLVNVLNPKVALVMLALLPQFANTDLGYVPLQIILIGLVHALVASLVLLAIVWVAAGATSRLRANPRVSRIFRTIAGLLLIGVGMRLAVSRA